MAGMKRFASVAALFVVVAVFLTVPPAGSPAQAQAGPFAITNGRLFDGTGAAVIDDGVVVIEGARIVAAGPAGEVAIPAGAFIMDAGGGLIMPGVIDNHVHITESLITGDILTPWLRAGVTTLVDTGTVRDGAVVDGVLIVDGIEVVRAFIVGVTERPPRVLLAGPLLTAPGGYPATRREPGYEVGAQPVTGPEDGRRLVESLAGRADIIKVAIETGFESDYDDVGWPVLDPETLAAIADAAREAGLLSRAHVTQEGELAAALDAGFDVAAHTPIDPLSDEILQRAADAGMIFVSTANIWGPDRGEAVPENLRRYLELGGRVAMGTDFPFQFGAQMPVGEMQMLVDGGITPEQVLLAATRDSAAAVGREHDLGTLEPGKLADVIVVDGDPLTNIADMANVSVVLLEGELIVPQPSTLAPLGDTNCDFTVSSIDAALILQHVAGLLPDFACVEQADVNANGDVNAVDAALVLQFVAGLLFDIVNVDLSGVRPSLHTTLWNS